ncbi:MAG: WYL domain-containing protein [Fibrobacteres bacterium]|nr:WYL domain-containing protein [Fibrobacterota bacterium]
MKSNSEFTGKAERLLALVEALISSKNALSASDIAENFGITARSAERYLDILRTKFSFPIEEERSGKRVAYRLNLAALTFGTSPLSEEESDALYMASELTKLLPGTHFAQGMDLLLARMEPTIPKEFRTALAAGIRVHPGPVTDLADWKDTIAVLTKAIRNDKKVKLVYTSRSGGEKIKQYTINPYTLFFHPDGLYIAGKKDGENGVRVWAVHRISSAILQNAPIERDPDFNFEDRFSLSLGAFQGGAGVEVILRISGNAFKAFRVMRLPPVTKKVYPSKGVMELTFKVTGLEELKRLILSYPDEVEVLSPLSFRKEIVDNLKAALRKYG